MFSRFSIPQLVHLKLSKICPTLISVRHFDPHGGKNKQVKLLPPLVEYDPKDERFLSGPKPEDTAFARRTGDEIIDLSTIKMEHEYDAAKWTKVDINQEPFNQVLKDDPGNNFTEVEVLKDPKLWFWVERLAPKLIPEPHPYQPGISTPSGFLAPPKVKPDLSYFVPRTRNSLFAVYLHSELPASATRDYLKGWIFNKYKKYYIEDPYENEYPEPLVCTLIRRVAGDVWQLEEDLRGDLEMKYQKRILSSCNEVTGDLKLKGDYVTDVVNWLIEKGF